MRNAILWPLLCAGLLCTTTAPAQPTAPACQSTVSGNLRLHPGVDHAGKDRAHEYLPYRDFVGNPDMDEPAGKRFPDFRAREVMPLVDARYCSLPGASAMG